MLQERKAERERVRSQKVEKLRRLAQKQAIDARRCETPDEWKARVSRQYEARVAKQEQKRAELRRQQEEADAIRKRDALIENAADAIIDLIEGHKLLNPESVVSIEDIEFTKNGTPYIKDNKPPVALDIETIKGVELEGMEPTPRKKAVAKKGGFKNEN